MTEPTTDPYLLQRKIEILAAAQAVFVRHGFERSTMQAIADEAGISAGAIYRYFPSKESLITTVCTAAASGYMSAFDIEGGHDGRETLIRGGRSIWDVLFGPEGDDALCLTVETTISGFRDPEVIGAHLREQMAGEVDRLTEIVEGAQRDGSLAADLDSRALGTLLLAVTQGTHVLNGQLQDGVDVHATWLLLKRMVEGLSVQAPPTD